MKAREVIKTRRITRIVWDCESGHQHKKKRVAEACTMKAEKRAARDIAFIRQIATEPWADVEVNLDNIEPEMIPAPETTHGPEVIG